MSKPVVGTNQFGKPITKEGLIERVESLHGEGKYDFSDSVYTRLSAPLTVRCIKHNHLFETTGSLLINKIKVDSCDYCLEDKIGRKKKMTTADFREAAVKKHGEKYDYSEVVYINTSTKVKIWCNTHSEFFWQTPNKHLMGRGCPKCAIENRAALRTIPDSEYIAKLTSVFGDDLDLSNFKYNSSNSTFTARCAKHDIVFSQLIGTAKKGRYGCPKCKVDRKIAGSKNRSQNAFNKMLESCKDIHNNQYDYSFVEHHSIRKPVSILCTKHDEMFKQVLQVHSNGFSACKECYKEKTRALYAYTNDEYKKSVEETHGVGVFDLSLVEYVSSHEKVKAICVKHNTLFEIDANSFKRGCNGCIDCKRENATNLYDIKNMSEDQCLEDAIFYHVRFIKEDKSTFDKIGITKRSVRKRFPKSYLRKANLKLITINTINTNWGDAIEREVEAMAKLEQNGLKYKIHYLQDYEAIAGWTECFPTGSIDFSHLFN